MDEIKQRLKDATEACISTFEAWRGKPTDPAAREALQEAVHELRKVGARLEIELAVSDRKNQGNEPIPIPSHRASRRQGPGADLENADTEDNFNNSMNRNQGRPPQGGNRDNRQGGGGGQGRPVNIRRPSETTPAAAAAPESNGNNAQPGNEAAAGGDDDGQRKPRPLSLRRSSDNE